MQLKSLNVLKFWGKKPVVKQVSEEQAQEILNLTDDLANANYFGRYLPEDMVRKHYNYFQKYVTDNKDVDDYIHFLITTDPSVVISQQILSFISYRERPMGQA